MHPRLVKCFRFFIVTRLRAVLMAVLLVLSAVALWRGWNTLSFHRNQAAAEQALADYDFPAARRHLATCLALQPDDPAVLLHAARAARRDGQLDKAAVHLDRYAWATGVSTPEGELELALLQVQLGQVKQNVYFLIEEMEIRHPATEQILESLALGCVHVYRLDEASFWTKQLVNRYPQNPVGRLLDAQTHDTLRQRDEALEITQRLLDDYPNFDKARIYLAGLLFKTHQYEAAVPYYRELHERRPDDLAPLLGLAAALLKLERLDEVRPLMVELETKHANSSVALLECSRFAMQQKRPVDAERLLQRAVELAPHDHEIHLELATCLEQLGRSDESRRHLERFQEIETDMKQLDLAFKAMIKAPSDPTPRVEAGRICLRNGQTSEGLRWLLGVVDLVPNHPEARELLANSRLAEGIP